MIELAAAPASNDGAVIAQNGACAQAARCRLEVYDSFAALDHHRDEWDQLAIDTKSPIFMSYDWTRVWWEFYGGGKRLRILVCRMNHELVGVLPVFIETLGVWPVRLRVARLVGSGLPPHVLNPPVRADAASDVFARAIEHLFSVEPLRGHLRCKRRAED